MSQNESEWQMSHGHNLRNFSSFSFAIVFFAIVFGETPSETPFCTPFSISL